MEKCLTVDPAARISWVEIYNHPVLNKTSIELIYGISNTSQIFQNNYGYYRR
jgi:serine/threonine protein kinase